MRIPTIIAVAMLSIIPQVTVGQEAPLTETSTIPQIEQPIEAAITTETPMTSPSSEENNEELTQEVTTLTEPTENAEETSQEAFETTEPAAIKTIEEMPEPVEEEPIVIPEEAEKQEAPAGIDTVSLENPQGNWLYKRIWWERAEERYEKNREEQGDLNEQERSLYESIATEEETLKQLKQDIVSIANLDHAIDDALGTLMNQINRVRQYERQAWENFKEIAHILNDTKARELYYMIEGAARNIKNISTYIEQDFFNHFAKLIEDATKHINRVQNQIEGLKEKGVSFKRQTELLEQQQEQLQEEEEEEEVAPKPKLSWFGWIMSGLNNISNFIFSIIRIPYDMIFGK